jgi:hypothetical protein
MQSQQIPFTIDAEYRGRQAEGGEFVNDQGDTVAFGPAYKFEYDLPDGEPVVMPLREGAVDKAADFDAASLKKGERVQLVGVAVIPERGSDRSGFVRLFTLRRAEGRVRAAA